MPGLLDAQLAVYQGATILAQAEPGPTRPSLPATVPTVAAMAARIAEVYESL